MSISETILTEDYAHKFNEISVPPGANLNNPILGYKSDFDQDSVFTEDMDTRDGGGMNFDDKDPYNVERKYQEILMKRKNRTPTYQPVSYQPMTSQFNDPYRMVDDQSTVFDDYSMAIHQKKSSIQKDLEFERREKNRIRSMSPIGMSAPWKSDLMSPRETFEQKIHDLDQLSSSVKKATMEHHQLCRDLDEIKSQLRKNQADIRFSERLARDNEEKVEYVNKELRDAERRRDQTMRQVDLVNEELSLKQTKLKSLDAQISREMADIRRMERYGIDKDEIENILAERDELYQIVKKQEDIQLEKYEMAKQMDLMRDDFQSEQDKAIKQIQCLEDELEASMRRMKQMQFEKEDIEAQLNHTKHHLCQAEDEICKSAREVSELRGEYQSKIKKKLEEYEQDKERVEKELKKLEEEKSLDQANLKRHIDQIRTQLKNTEHERQDLSAIVADLESHLQEANETRIQIIEEHEMKIQNLKKDKEREMENLKLSLEREQKMILEDEKIKFGHEKNCLQRQLDDEMDHLLRNIELKDKEIIHLQGQLKETESSYSEKMIQDRKNLDNQLKVEKSTNEIKVKKLNLEIERIKDDHDEEKKRLKHEMERIKNSLLDRDNQILDLKKKLTDSQADIKRINNENLNRFKKFKETFREDIVKSLKHRYEQKMDEELVKVKSEFDRKLSRQNQDKSVLEDNAKHNKLLLHKIVKTVIHEVNQECGKIAVLLNVQPRKINASKSIGDFSKSDNIITQALANLEACGSETRSLVHELESKIKSLSDELVAKETMADNDIRDIRRQMETEKNKDVSIIREKLMKEHLREINKMAKSCDSGLKNLLQEKEREVMKMQSERQLWKEKAAEKIAEKFDKINQKKIADIRQQLMKRERELRRLRCVGRPRSISPTLMPSNRPQSISPTVGHKVGNRMNSRFQQHQQSRVISGLNLDTVSSSSPAKVIGSLQDNLEQLRRENTDLRHQISQKRSESNSPTYQKLSGRESRNKYRNENNDLGFQLRLSRSCSRSRE